MSWVELTLKVPKRLEDSFNKLNLDMGEFLNDFVRNVGYVDRYEAISFVLQWIEEGKLGIEDADDVYQSGKRLYVYLGEYDGHGHPARIEMDILSGEMDFQGAIPFDLLEEEISEDAEYSYESIGKITAKQLHDICYNIKDQKTRIETFEKIFFKNIDKIENHITEINA